MSFKWDAEKWEKDWTEYFEELMTDENEIDGGKSLNGIFLMHEISIYAFFLFTR